MNAGLNAFLNGLIDYAGLFPPAKLPITEAFPNFQHYRESTDAFMLSRFVCPVAAFAPFCDLMSSLENPATRMSAVGGEQSGQLSSWDEFVTELTYLPMLQDSHDGALAIESYEAKLSPELMQSILDEQAQGLSGARSSIANRLVSCLRDHDRPLICYFEAPVAIGSFDYRAVLALIELLMSANRTLQGFRDDQQFAIKLRCGGAFIPTAADLAEAVAMCVQSHVAFKATAGLHHPLFDPSRSEPHGFVSLFATALLAHKNGLTDSKELKAMLSDTTPEAFVFNGSGLSWQGQYSMTVADIVTARAELAHSFGSCSFDEPRADLRTMGWM